MMEKWGKRMDYTWVGVLAAVVLPVIAFFLFWQIKYGEKDWEQLYYYITLNSANRNDLLIFPLLPNLVLFYFTNFQWRWDRFTLGIVATTVILAVPTVIALI
ncbi:MAG: hypothetical protein ACQERC_10185 [Bacteroidota bacterium]